MCYKNASARVSSSAANDPNQLCQDSVVGLRGRLRDYYFILYNTLKIQYYITLYMYINRKFIKIYTLAIDHIIMIYDVCFYRVTYNNQNRITVFYIFIQPKISWQTSICCSSRPPNSSRI